MGRRMYGVDKGAAELRKVIDARSQHTSQERRLARQKNHSLMGERVAILQTVLNLHDVITFTPAIEASLPLKYFRNGTARDLV